MNSAKRFFIAFGLIGALFGWLGSTAPVFACSCAMATPAEQFDNATAVFVGAVTNISLDGGKRLIDFDVSESRKGSVAESITVATGWGDGDCGFDFEAGREYVVYAYGEGRLETGICNGTSLLIASIQDDNGEVGITNSSTEPVGEAEKSGNSIVPVVIAVIISFTAGALATQVVGRRKKLR